MRKISFSCLIIHDKELCVSQVLWVQKICDASYTLVRAIQLSFMRCIPKFEKQIQALNQLEQKGETKHRQLGTTTTSISKDESISGSSSSAKTMRINRNRFAFDEDLLT